LSLTPFTLLQRQHKPAKTLLTMVAERKQELEIAGKGA
jgi:hypothetical protein